MLISTVFGLLLISVANGFRNCEDCTNLYECSQAVQEMNNNYNEEVVKKLREAQCGYNSEAFKVCCSDFNINKEPEINNEEEIENHPNIGLLSDECGVIEGNRIIGGNAASLYEFPWLVLISYRNGDKLEFHCGGSLINTRYVLTAAHCMQGQVIAGVRVGEYDISKKVDCYGGPNFRECESRIQDIAVSHKIIHPGYKKFPHVVNDIGLLRLRKTVDFSARNAGAVCLPVFQNLQEQDLSGEYGVIAGWGKTETSERSDILLKVEVPIHPKETCINAFKKRSTRQGIDDLFKDTLCAGESGADSCQGDSGGPLMLEGEYNDTYKTVQYGVVSYGIGCGIGKPAIYTDIRKFMKWILDTIKP